ncbi:MAG: ferritin-like domain-containing protein, partial [Candidatus Kapaibacterium sp.]
MKLENLVTDIQSKVEDNNKSRREVIGDIGKMGLSAALAAIPFGLATITTPLQVKAQGSGVIDILNFALTLEYLEDEFYRKGVESGIFSGSELIVIQQISKHEKAHVDLLRGAISGSGGTPVSKPTFDFTAGGAFGDVFSN